MTDVNTTLPLIEPFGEMIKNITSILSVLLGGVFGVYLLILVLRWRELFMMKKLRNDMNAKMTIIEEKIDALTVMINKNKKKSNKKNG